MIGLSYMYKYTECSEFRLSMINHELKNTIICLTCFPKYLQFSFKMSIYNSFCRVGECWLPEFDTNLCAPLTYMLTLYLVKSSLSCCCASVIMAVLSRPSLLTWFRRLVTIYQFNLLLRPLGVSVLFCIPLLQDTYITCILLFIAMHFYDTCSSCIWMLLYKMHCLTLVSGFFFLLSSETARSLSPLLSSSSLRQLAVSVSSFLPPFRS